MPEFTIEKVFVFPTEKEGSLIKGFARIEIEGGLFISELRIFEDSRNPKLLYVSFPTRKNNRGDDKKTIYPNNDRARKRITDAITKKYLEELSHD